MATYLQITLKSFFLEEEAFQENMNGSNLLSSVLVYPRAGVKSVETLTRLDLVKGKKLSFRSFAFSDKILFKEIIEGDSELKLSLSAVEQPDEIEKILQSVIQTGVGIGLGMVTGGPGIALITALSKTVLDSVFDLARPAVKTTVIGTQHFPINSALEEGELPLHLSTPADIVLYSREIREGEDVLVRKTLKKGMGVATCVLDIKKIPLGQQDIPVV